MATDPNLPQLVYGGKYLLPERDSYSFSNPDGSRRTDITGGPMRIDTDHLGGPFVVNVQYFADSQAMVWFFQKFWLNQTFEGSIPFQCALALESPDIAEDYTVRLKSAPQWNGFTGFNGRVSLTYEVEQKLIDYEYDDTLLWILAEYGDDAADTFNQLDILTNDTMDTWIPG